MKRCLFGGHLACATLFLALSPCLWAQSGSELTISGTVYYSGRHTGPVHIVAVDENDVSNHVDVNDVPFAAQTTISEPGPYFLTVLHAYPGHSYLVFAQMDIDNSGVFTLESFKTYEPSGDNRGCIRSDHDPLDPLSTESFALPGTDICLSDAEPQCVLLSTFEPGFFCGGASDMGYHAGHLWICDTPTPALGGPADVHKVDPNTASLVASYDLGIDHCTSLQWIGSEMWVCFTDYSSWKIRQYSYDGTAFTQGVSHDLPSRVDWDTVWSVNIAWNGSLLWVQEKGPCGAVCICKLNLADGSLDEVVSDRDFTLGKWLALGDMSDICFSDGWLWAMNDDAPTFAKMAVEPNQVPADMHYTFAFDLNRDVFDDSGRYYGMVKQGDLVYFVEGIDIEDARGEVIRREHRIHTARIEQADQSGRDLIFKLGGQYWFGSLSVDPETLAPWAKRGSVSIVGNQWHQEWDDGNGSQPPFTSDFAVAEQQDGSINVRFAELPGETYNVAWNGDLMIHAGRVLHGGGERIDIFTRKVADVDANDVVGDYGLFGHHFDTISPGDSCNWGNVTFEANGTATATWTNDRGVPESDPMNWILDDVNDVVRLSGEDALFFGKGDIGLAWQILPEEGRSGHDLGYAALIKKTDQAVKMADIAGTYQVRFLETGPGSVPYTCDQGTCVIEAVDDAHGVLSVDAYYSDGEHDVGSIDCSVGPGNEFHLDDESVPDGIVSPDKNLIFLAEYRYKHPPTRRDYDWLGGIFLVRVPAANNNTAELKSTGIATDRGQ